MSNFNRTEGANKDGFRHINSGVSSDDLSNQVHDWFVSNGYKLKSGEEGNGTYEKGSRTARLLLGAFYKYFKWDVNTNQNGEDASVSVSKESSGMSGGIIGVKQVKKELENVSNNMMAL